MKIIFIHTYPIYHSGKTVSDWIKLENRDKWMPSLLVALGHEVEYWVGGTEEGSFRYIDPENELPSYTIRSFETVKTKKRAKFHFSKTMVAYAQKSGATHFILKGVDGGIGEYLLDSYLRPNNIPYSFVIGGDYYSKHVPHAKFVYYETNFQKQQLLDPNPRFWRKKCTTKQLHYLPKSINTNVFKPDNTTQKKWDIISVGRLVPNYKNYDELGELSNTFRVCLVGNGPLLSSLQKKYPNMHFAGNVPNHLIPAYISQSNVFFHSGKRDFNPRVITEAMACGVPPVAFNSIIKEDVIPTNCGYLIPEKDLNLTFNEILTDQKKVDYYGKNARLHILNERSRTSSLQILEHTIGKVISPTHPVQTLVSQLPM